ncbi:C16orf52-like protein B [Oryzias melastigma]|uniref:C16orf52-like protein B n=1 Tax=Oryzias melastigma TaxID=30732 RepID=A0A834F819_ORYME|nr:C16orf52-like protein B [Oryzias melastigma]
MDKPTVISACLFLAADIFAIASVANPDWINTGDKNEALSMGLVRQCQTLYGRDRTCIPPRLPREWVATLLFIVLGIISLTVTCCLLVMSHWHHKATRYARWIAFTGKFVGDGSHGNSMLPKRFQISDLKLALQRAEIQQSGISDALGSDVSSAQMNSVLLDVYQKLRENRLLMI